MKPGLAVKIFASLIVLASVVNTYWLLFELYKDIGQHLDTTSVFPFTGFWGGLRETLTTDRFLMFLPRFAVLPAVIYGILLYSIFSEHSSKRISVLTILLACYSFDTYLAIALIVNNEYADNYNNVSLGFFVLACSYLLLLGLNRLASRRTSKLKAVS